MEDVWTDEREYLYIDSEILCYGLSQVLAKLDIRSINYGSILNATEGKDA